MIGFLWKFLLEVLVAGAKKGTPDRLMDAIFDPKSVAVVGVPEGMKIGRFFLMGLLSMGYKGKIYPVNPRLDEIDGIKVIKNTRDIPGPLDLAIVLVSKRHLFGVIEDLGAVGTRAAVIFTSGLGELGEEGMKEQRELLDLARKYNIRLIGPNCQGVHVPKSGLSFFPQMPKDVGDISFVSGSGSLASLSIMRAASMGLFFSKVVSFGNAADLTPSDFISYLAGDPETKVIISYIEGIPEGRRFFDTLFEVTSKKPVVVWKAGLTSFGREAARSHTGAMTGEAELWEGALVQAGAVTAQGMDEILDAAMALKLIPRNTGDRVAIVSGPGGLAVVAADYIERAGLSLAHISNDTKKKIAGVIPDVGTSTRNPVDVGLGASGDPGLYTMPARYLMEDDNVDCVLVIGGTFSEQLNEIFTKELISAQRETKKAVMMVDLPEFRIATGGVGMGKEFVASGIPAFPSHERALSALKKVCDYGKFLKRG